MLGCTDPAADNYNPAANTDDSTCTYGSVLGCTDPTACNYDPLATADDGNCLTPDGCTDPAYVEYDPNAQCDDGSCATLCVDGCTNSAFTEYDPNATCDDGSCSTAVVLGCTDPTQFNYDPNANTDDGSCVPIVNGCTDATADNYDSAANTDDGSCTYTSTPGVTAVSYFQGSHGGNQNCTDKRMHLWCLYSSVWNNNHGSKYDPYLNTINGTWTYNGVTYTATFIVHALRDLDRGFNVDRSNMSSYLNLYPNSQNFGIRKMHLFDVSVTGESHHGTCAYNHNQEWQYGSLVTFDPPTNPYNL